MRCLTCPNYCVVGEGEVTFCRTRINRGGKLYTLTYGKPCLINTDSLQKNPLYHVAPGAEAVGTATAGCNLRCKYCQNWDVSQVGPWETRNMDVSPAQLVAKAEQRGIQWLTFSYTELVAYLKYALDAAGLARERGLKVAVVTSGLINPHPLRELIKVSDALSITLKGYNNEFYRDVCAARLDDIWSTIKMVKQSGRWLEIVTLIVPGMNDEEEGNRCSKCRTVIEGIDLG